MDFTPPIICVVDYSQTTCCSIFGESKMPPQAHKYDNPLVVKSNFTVFSRANNRCIAGMIHLRPGCPLLTLSHEQHRQSWENDIYKAKIKQSFKLSWKQQINWQLLLTHVGNTLTVYCTVCFLTLNTTEKSKSGLLGKDFSHTFLTRQGGNVRKTIFYCFTACVESSRILLYKYV